MRNKGFKNYRQMEFFLKIVHLTQTYSTRHKLWPDENNGVLN